MKSRPHSVPSSARASHRRLARASNRALAPSKFLISVQTVDAVAVHSSESGKAEFVVPSPVTRGEDERKVAMKPPANAMDPQKLLHFSQQLYAHALTLQEVIRNGGEIAYDVLRPRCDRQAARQFELFYGAADAPATQTDFEPESAS